MKDKQIKILVVDDTVAVLELIRFSLESFTNWQVKTVSSARECLLVAQRELPDIIISDIRMPQMNGLEMTQRLRAHVETKHIPILFITSLPELVSAQECQKLNIRKVIAKPFDPLTLAERIIDTFHNERHESLNTSI